MERKDLDSKDFDPKSKGFDEEPGREDRPHRSYEGTQLGGSGGSSLESQMQDMGLTAQGGGAAGGGEAERAKRGHVGSGPKPYTGREQVISGMDTSGQMGSHRGQTGSHGGSFTQGRSPHYVGLGKIAKQLDKDVQELRSCAHGHGLIPDKTQRSCDMYSEETAQKIMQACGFKLG
jgi:hypothetical protein